MNSREESIVLVFLIFISLEWYHKRSYDLWTVISLMCVCIMFARSEGEVVLGEVEAVAEREVPQGEAE